MGQITSIFVIHELVPNGPTMESVSSVRQMPGDGAAYQSCEAGTPVRGELFGDSNNFASSSRGQVLPQLQLNRLGDESY